MSEHGTSLRLQVEPVAASLEPTRQAVRAFLAPFALREPALYAVELVLEEVLSNQIKYAFAGRTAEPVALGVEVGDERIGLVFEDRGVAFDPLQAPEPKPAASIDEARVGGLGLALLRRHSSTARYERRDGVNRLAIGIAR